VAPAAEFAGEGQGWPPGHQTRRGGYQNEKEHMRVSQSRLRRLARRRRTPRGGHGGRPKSGERVRHGTTRGARLKRGVAFLTLLRTSGRAFRRWRGVEDGDRHRRRLGFAELGRRRACGDGERERVGEGVWQVLVLHFYRTSRGRGSDGRAMAINGRWRRPVLMEIKGEEGS
jgi:hypothetical protein